MASVDAPLLGVDGHRRCGDGQRPACLGGRRPPHEQRPDRYLASRDVPFEVAAYQDAGPPLDKEVAALPAVRAIAAITFVFGGLTTGGPDEPFDGLVFAGDAKATGDRVIAGREPEPARRGEFVASKDLADKNGLSIGEAVSLVTLTPEQVAENGFIGGEPDGPTLDAVLVGLIDGPADLTEPTGIAVFDRSLIDDEPRIATSGSVFAIDLVDGATIEQLREQLDTIGGEVLRLEPSAVIGPETRRTIDAQALGLWILTAFAGLVTTAALGQLLVRHARLAASEKSTLSSLGATRLQVVGETVARAGVIAAVAVALAAVLAMSASGIFPVRLRPPGRARSWAPRRRPRPRRRWRRPRPRDPRLGGRDDPVPPNRVADSPARRRRRPGGEMPDDDDGDRRPVRPHVTRLGVVPVEVRSASP